MAFAGGMDRAVAVVALIVLLLPSYGVAQSTKYKKGAAVPLFANKVRLPPASTRAFLCACAYAALCGQGRWWLRLQLTGCFRAGTRERVARNAAAPGSGSGGAGAETEEHLCTDFLFLRTSAVRQLLLHYRIRPDLRCAVPVHALLGVTCLVSSWCSRRLRNDHVRARDGAEMDGEAPALPVEACWR